MTGFGRICWLMDLRNGRFRDGRADNQGGQFATEGPALRRGPERAGQPSGKAGQRLMRLPAQVKDPGQCGGVPAQPALWSAMACSSCWRGASADALDVTFPACAVLLICRERGSRRSRRRSRWAERCWSAIARRHGFARRLNEVEQ